MMISEQDIEQISAYLDDELSSEEMQKVRQRLLQDPAFREEFDAMKGGDEMLVQFSGSIDTTPVPERVKQLLGKSEESGQHAYGFFASAAAVLLLIGGLFVLQERPAPYAWLDSLESGKAFESANGTVEVIATFNHKDGRVCREAKTNGKRAVFCRTSDDWQMVLEVAASDAPNGTYQPAGVSNIHDIDRFVRENMQGLVLTLEEEQALMQNHWQ
jgi:hypothetical protein